MGYTLLALVFSYCGLSVYTFSFFHFGGLLKGDAGISLS
jgi:hypothetical protein